jgi:transposase
MESAASPNPACPRCRELEQIIARLEARVRDLEQKLEAALRSGKRQAAPFRKVGGPKLAPKPPGRKSGEGHGPHVHRATPTPEQITETIEVPLPRHCEHCHSHDIAPSAEREEQFQTEIPRIPIVRRFDIQVGTCRGCGRTVRGRQALQTSQATGAASHQLGPDAHAALTVLNKEMGLSHGKVAQVFRQLFGITIARSTSARSQERMTLVCQSAYEQIRQTLRESTHSHCDETGWRVGGLTAWLHVFVTGKATCYVVDPTRSAQPALELFGHGYAGTLGHDGWAPYQAFVRAHHQQCVPHLLNRCKELRETLSYHASLLARQLSAIFKRALLWRDEHPHASDQLRRAIVWDSVQQVGELTDGTVRYRHPENRKLAKFVWKHITQWFRFLLDPLTSASNAAAEQAIRPAAVNRKVWGGNRTWNGARRQGVLSSILRTLWQRSLDTLDFLAQARCSTTPLLLPVDT